MVDTARFEVGGNLALSKGAVVLRTEVFELLEYAPTTKTVYEVPLLRNSSARLTKSSWNWNTPPCPASG